VQTIQVAAAEWSPVGPENRAVQRELQYVTLIVRCSHIAFVRGLNESGRFVDVVDFLMGHARSLYLEVVSGNT